MDKGNLETILNYAQSETERSKVKLIRDFDPVKRDNVPDPYYGTEDDFQEVFQILDRTIDNLILSLTRQS
jgi:protein-tyrosine phosphatase